MRDKPAIKAKELPAGILLSDLERVKSFYDTPRGKELYEIMYSDKNTEDERKAAQAAFNAEQEEFRSKPENQGIDQFEIWQTERFGWCIPTLLISNPGRRQRASAYNKGVEATERTYAITIDRREIVTIGGGPHVKNRLTVYVSAARRPGLGKFLDLKEKGEIDANNIRDRISSRRAQGALRRSAVRSWF